MKAAGPLAGRTIVVTRPRAQADALAEAIAAAGGSPLVFPLLEIAPAPDAQALRAAVERIDDYALAVFVSPNAVAFSLPAILGRGHWPPNLRPAAVGPGTVKALAGFGVHDCLVPSQRFDSEALLALPELANVAGQRVVIFRGDGGRELLADTLRERGAVVDCVSCYQRRSPAAGFQPLMAAWERAGIDAFTLSSSEALRYLVAGLSAPWRARLEKTPVFVPHARIASTARELGLQQVVLTGAADRGLIEGLVAYNWSA